MFCTKARMFVRAGIYVYGFDGPLSADSDVFCFRSCDELDKLFLDVLVSKSLSIVGRGQCS